MIFGSNKYSDAAVAAANAILQKELPQNKQVDPKAGGKKVTHFKPLMERILGDSTLILGFLETMQIDAPIESDGVDTNAVNRLHGIMSDTKKTLQIVENVVVNSAESKDREYIKGKAKLLNSQLAPLTKNIPPRNTVRHLRETAGAIEAWLKTEGHEARINQYAESILPEQFKKSLEGYVVEGMPDINPKALGSIFSRLATNAPEILRAHADQLEFYADDIVNLYPLAAADQGRGEGGGTPPRPPRKK
jgi:hypothetical protein